MDSSQMTHSLGSIRVLIAEDHELVREGLKRMLGSCDEIHFVGETGDGSEVARLVGTTSPDVVLLDLSLPGMQGLDVLAELRRGLAPCRILILTVHDDEDSIIAAVQLGAEGYVLKQTTRAELIAAIRRVAGGGCYYDQSVLPTILAAQTRASDAAKLTDRETEILRELVGGLSNRDIAQRLYLSPDTVKTHLGSIYRKLGVESRTQAVATALREKLVS